MVRNDASGAVQEIIGKHLIPLISAESSIKRTGVGAVCSLDQVYLLPINSISFSCTSLSSRRNLPIMARSMLELFLSWLCK